MTLHDRERKHARLRTLETIRAELYSADGLTLRLRTPLYCDPKLRGHRLIPRTVLS